MRLSETTPTQATSDHFSLTILVMLAVAVILHGCSWSRETPTGVTANPERATSPPPTQTLTLSPKGSPTATNTRPPMAPEDWPTRLLSVSPDGRPSEGAWAQLSADARYAVFVADSQVFLREMETGTTRLVSATTDGARGDDWSFASAISGDGSTVAFFSLASNLVEDPYLDCPEQGKPSEADCGQLYVYDVASRKLERVPVAAFRHATADIALSEDGHYVAFAVSGALYREGVYLYDTRTGELTTISAGDVSDSQVLFDVGGTTVDISADGRYVAFASPDNGIVPDDQNGVSDVFVYDREEKHVERISAPIDGVESGQPSGFQWVPNTGGDTESGLAISADGRYVVFMSAAPNLVKMDLPPCPHWPWADEMFPACRHIYLRDREMGTTELISVSDTGEPGNRASQDGDISADGRWVVFTSLASNLTPDRLAGCRDFSFDGFCPQVFARDRQKGKTYLVSKGWDNRSAEAYSHHPVISPDGRYVAFQSGAGNLAPGIPVGQSQYAFITDIFQLLEVHR